MLLASSFCFSGLEHFEQRLGLYHTASQIPQETVQASVADNIIVQERQS